MAKKRSLMVNNDLGGNQIVYLDKDKSVKDTIETYNVSANDIEVDKLVAKVYDQFNASKERQLMLDGIKYYDNDTNIDNKVRYDHCGTDSKVNDKLSNSKMKKNIMRKLTRQKVNTLLGKPYSITTKDETYKKILEDIFKRLNAKDRTNAVTIAFIHRILNIENLILTIKRYNVF